jgi:hypothetical protein
MKILLFGATGMVGDGVLRWLIASPKVSRVVAVSRKPLAVQPPKLETVIEPDMFHLQHMKTLRDLDACFFCLGASSVGMSPYRDTSCRSSHDRHLPTASESPRGNRGTLHADRYRASVHPLCLESCLVGSYGQQNHQRKVHRIRRSSPFPGPLQCCAEQQPWPLPMPYLCSFR